MIRLRSYQEDAVRAVLADIANGIHHPAVVIPTGGGKTIVFSALIKKYLDVYGGRALVLAHRDELVQQAAAKYRSVDPHEHVGIVKASINEADARVVIGSVQTLRNPGRRQQLDNISIIVVDECHHATAKSYREILDYFNIPTVGFTATLARGDGTSLGTVWKKISYEIPILRLIRSGYLSDVRGISVEVPDLDLRGLSKWGGDYNDIDLGERLQDSVAPQLIAEAYMVNTPADSGIIFAPTVDTAKMIEESMKDSGFSCATVWGGMPREGRVKILEAFSRGDIQVLSNCMLLTEGFDAPRAKTVVIARPTRSAPLYIQMVGRVLRPWPGSPIATVLDVVGCARNHELATLATLAGKKEAREIPVGETLLKALGDDELSSSSPESSGYTGEVDHVVVDLFAGSRQAWLQTKGGRFFLPAGERFIVLIEREGAYDVAWVKNNSARGGWIAKGVEDFGYAMATGEGDITEDEELYSAKDRGWKKRKPSEKQVTFARSIGVEIPAGKIKAGELSDLINIELASRRIDARM